MSTPTIKPRKSKSTEDEDVYTPPVSETDPPDEKPIVEPPDEQIQTTEAPPPVTDQYSADTRDPDAPRGALPTIKPRQAEEEPAELAVEDPAAAESDVMPADDVPAAAQTAKMLPSAEELRNRKRDEFDIPYFKNRKRDEFGVTYFKIMNSPATYNLTV